MGSALRLARSAMKGTTAAETDPMKIQNTVEPAILANHMSSNAASTESAFHKILMDWK